MVETSKSKNQAFFFMIIPNTSISAQEAHLCPVTRVIVHSAHGHIHNMYG